MIEALSSLAGGQGLLKSPKGRNASRDSFVKLG